jgi:hypothetical protein
MVSAEVGLVRRSVLAMGYLAAAGAVLTIA